MRTTVFAAMIVLGLSACSSVGARAPDWTKFADCAAAYRVNAAIADPGRAATMTAMVSEVADDYEKTARERYAAQHGGAAVDAQPMIASRVATQSTVFRSKSRIEVEHFIDACPQTEP